MHTISITDNDALLAVPSYSTNANEGLEIAIGTDFERSVITAQHIYEVGNNARIASISCPDGFIDVEQVAIWGNPSLVTLDLHALSHANGLLLTNNSQLRDLQMPGLVHVGRLESEITHNCRLRLSPVCKQSRSPWRATPAPVSEASAPASAREVRAGRTSPDSG